MNKFLLFIDILTWWFSFERSSPEVLALDVLLMVAVSIYLNYRLARQNKQSALLWSLIGLFGFYGVIAHYIQLSLRRKASKEG